MDHPGVRFPPPFLFAAGFLSGLALERWLYRLPLGGSAQSRTSLASLGWLGVAVGLTLVFWALMTFWRARTAVIPHHPATRLVRSGPYQFSRNPMYVALSILYFGVALVFGVAWPLIIWPAVIGALYLLVVRREERYLAGAFAEEYAAYRDSVRRWL